MYKIIKFPRLNAGIEFNVVREKVNGFLLFRRGGYGIICTLGRMKA